MQGFVVMVYELPDGKMAVRCENVTMQQPGATPTEKEGRWVEELSERIKNFVATVPMDKEHLPQCAPACYGTCLNIRAPSGGYEAMLPLQECCSSSQSDRGQFKLN